MPNNINKDTKTIKNSQDLKIKITQELNKIEKKITKKTKAINKQSKKNCRIRRIWNRSYRTSTFSNMP